MSSDEKRHKDMSGARKDGKSKTSNHPADVDKDKTSGMSFLIEYKLVAGKLQGKITNRLTHKHEESNGKHEEFTGHGDETIMPFIKRFLSKVEKSVGNVPVEESPQPGEVKIASPGEMRKPGLEVIPEGSAQPSDILPHGQPFMLRWTFEPPSPSGITGERLHYRIVVCGKNLERGERIQIGKGSGQIDFGSALTALISFESLPPGMYFVEADAEFSLKSVKSYRQSLCSARRLIQVV